MNRNYKEILNDITTFVFDVDGVLTNGTVLVSSEGELLRSMNIKDGYALKKAVKTGYHVCIISGGKNEGVRKRLSGLGINNIFLGVEDKVECLNTFFNNHQIKAENVAYMGDDIPDIFPMKLIGLPTCPQDAVPEIKAISKYISHKNGGEGAGRDLIEQVMKVQGKWINEVMSNE
ncbi:3-deoxy-D-manno-octulosonate 8-phosphate phosphatase (KDO 8-P phosphatase) [Mesonia phycicola]|uniref:3-deoxy-D-manno-octulosonate 8-phosphate phosphatase (KDO 8-P phosphatase) n=1 Tax=Mesonia phycicola TaxID=579105 RepID=A0A1M6BWL6_9FLAO|nr:HAD-IIIA family hydrolase [Mesonia phycicola]SHI53057.1 3-deoxy-D-manno-octulosonate 8-phosphate phosphatase (KDO 8-P phosphatase) [Mesonia phycicola]